jgi:hypothetical protein
MGGVGASCGAGSKVRPCEALCGPRRKGDARERSEDLLRRAYWSYFRDMLPRYQVMSANL